MKEGKEIKDKVKSKVFLGGTCNNTTWREYLMPLLKIDYFNPVVINWNKKHIKIEENEKKTSNIHLYTITYKLTGIYSIVEMIVSASKDIITVICFDIHKLTKDQIKSVKASIKLIEETYPKTKILTINTGRNNDISNQFKKLAKVLNSL